MNKKLFWIYLLSGSIYFTQGIGGLPGMAFFFYLKEHLHYNPSTIMYISSVAGLAWLVKPLWGFICDNFLTKKAWIILSLLGSIIIALMFGLLNKFPSISVPIYSFFIFKIDTMVLPPIFFIVLLASLGNWNSAMRDVSVDGIMCQDGKESNSCDRIQAVQWTSITIASIFVGIFGGWIADHATYKVAYMALIPVYLIILGIVFNYRGAITTKINSTVKDTLLSYKSLFTDKKFLLVCWFLLLYKFNPSFGTPLMFIQRDTFRWSGTFMGMLAAIVSCFEIVGAIIFFKYCKKISIKKWLTVSVFLGAFSSLCYLYFTPYTAVGYGILFSVVGMFVHLIVMSFMAQATLPGKEATSFALLCSVNNIAGTLSSLAGSYLFPRVGLQLLIVISAGTSFLCLPLIKRLGIK